MPSDQIDSLRQYVGGETPTLHRLGGSDFAKAKSRVRSAVREIAQELVVLYQKRINAAGHAFGHDTPWQAEMEDGFPFVETPDQRIAIDDVKVDMERPYPMDRLLCGDVGFGKTEVAIRAAFKAIQDSKQVAVLAPTTLLVTQHGNTFADRFAGYPIRVETLSRFLTNKEAKRVIDGLASGEVDCVIGTHRLLQEGVAFKDLGLLIVDEEQRFGVQAKEAMKKLKVNVDVLTLSATPIPRTLEMSLVGIRDLSLLQTPPADRQPILTFVGEYDERVAVEALRRELLREGQVFWVHNRVKTISQCAERLRELVPEARIAVAHGQMDEGSLEQIVVDFWEGRYDVLVCTTIIESGIDMPTVNTLVVERADLLGLGQMHQLRGRVGRSGSRAYAYLFHPRDARLTEEAYERLRTIGEATDLGSGFKIAMRDLEIRGAGNLLGESQSGHIAAVGYDLYCQMVTEAVGEMKGEPKVEPSELKLDVPTDAYLPTDYVDEGGVATRGLPPIGGGHDGRRGRRHSHRMGGSLRSGAAAGGSVVDGRLPSRRMSPIGTARRVDRLEPGPPGPARVEDQRRDAPATTGPRCDLQARLATARGADQAWRRAGRVPRRLSPRTGACAVRLHEAGHEVAHRQARRARRLGRLAVRGATRRLDDPRLARGHRSAPARGPPRRGRRQPRTSSRNCPTTWQNVSGDCSASSATPGLPTAEVVGVVTERDPDADGLLITRNIDYSLPYRVLLSGRGLQIPYLGERVLDALAGLLVRLHLAGFYWGDCSLSNTLFRRDAGALSAYIIDVETGESHPTLSDGQRQLDLSIATENVAGDLEDLQAGGRLADGIDPISTALAIEKTYQRLWSELTGADEFDVNETFRIDHRLQRLHELGFDAAELELYTTADGSKLRLIPRVVEHGFHGQRLKALTGLETGENQARRLLNDISRYRAVLEQQSGRKVPETMAAARWLDERFEPTIDGVPPDLVGKLEPAELYHQVLEHLWFMSEVAGGDVGLGEAVTSYVRDVLTPAPDEQRPADKKWPDEIEDDEIDDDDRSRRGRAATVDR